MADQPQQQQSTSSEPEKGELPGIRSRVSSRSPMSVEALPAQMESPSASSPSQRDEMMACVVALEAALLPCLPARELQAVDRSVHSSHQSRFSAVSRVAVNSNGAVCFAFIESLLQEISAMEEELKSKSDLIKQQEKLVEEWRKELKEQLQRHITELERV
ncbi:hypothetical protein ZIOFF_004749 [Zingiber officinale]|uniref:Uncharacterized protein n=1 Tax=Zingiber officinale TaxID=94328 RepID=A0A8J5HUK5_ZINOF|nr:hypothetical protein ZIOFF_004749 [Zingiber officinale]